jgi:hypothetical protein
VGIYNNATSSTAGVVIRHATNNQEPGYPAYTSISAQGGGVPSKVILRGTEITLSSSTASLQTSVTVDGDITSSTHVINSNEGLILRTDDGSGVGEVRITPGSNPPTKFTGATLTGLTEMGINKLSGSFGGQQIDSSTLGYRIGRTISGTGDFITFQVVLYQVHLK